MSGVAGPEDSVTSVPSPAYFQEMFSRSVMSFRGYAGGHPLLVG